VKILKNLL